MRFLNRMYDRGLPFDPDPYATATAADDPGHGLEFVGWLVFTLLLATFDCLLLLLSQLLPDSPGS